MKHISDDTVQTIVKIFKSLDYSTLASIYCEEGGQKFWKAKRASCQTSGIQLALILRNRLKPQGRSLYVGAGVAEIPLMIMETKELHRCVEAYNLRQEEVKVINEACRSTSLTVIDKSAEQAQGLFDHVWIVSVLNDPECFPELSALSYGRANPATFNPITFSEERKKVQKLARRCLDKLSRPGLVTTSVEEIPWIENWSHQRNVPIVIEEKDYPTALVGDPICFIRVG